MYIRLECMYVAIRTCLNLYTQIYTSMCSSYLLSNSPNFEKMNEAFRKCIKGQICFVVKFMAKASEFTFSLDNYFRICIVDPVFKSILTIVSCIYNASVNIYLTCFNILLCIEYSKI